MAYLWEMDLSPGRRRPPAKCLAGRTMTLGPTLIVYSIYRMGSVFSLSAKAEGRRPWCRKPPSRQAPGIPPTSARSVLEAPRPAFHPVGDGLGPHPLDHAGVVIAVSEVVVQGGEAVTLTSVLHLLQLSLLELRMVDVAPVKGRRVHRETGRNRAVGADDHVVLPGPAIPVGEMQLPAGVLRNAGRVRQHRRQIPVGAGAIAVPAILFQIQPG